MCLCYGGLREREEMRKKDWVMGRKKGELNELNE